MLNKKTRAVMKVIYNKAIETEGTCLINDIDILEGIPYKMEFLRSELGPALKSLANEGFFEMIETNKDNETYYCITLQQAGYDFSRQIASEKRAFKMKIALTVMGVILSFILSRILSAIAS